MVLSRRLLRVQTAGRPDDGSWDRRFVIALALLLTAILSGCATSGNKPYPYFDRLSIEALPPAPAEENDAVASAGKLIAGGAAVGASGALMTGLVTSLACGPYFAVCLAGTGAAALGSAAVGAVMGGSLAPTVEEAERLNAYIDSLQQTHNLGGDLAAALTAQLPASRLSEAGTADAHLGLEIQPLRVLAGFKDTIALWVAVKATLEWDRNRETPNQAWRGFACQTESLPLETWLDIDRTDGDQQLTQCIDKLASEVIAALQEPGADTDPGATVGFGNYDPAATMH